MRRIPMSVRSVSALKVSSITANSVSEGLNRKWIKNKIGEDKRRNAEWKKVNRRNRKNREEWGRGSKNMVIIFK